MRTFMGAAIAAMGVVVLAALPAWAGSKKGGGGGGSQAGGLPAVEAQVDALIGQVTTLQGQVTTLQGQVTTLQGQVSTLNGEVTDLQGQNNWAVVAAAGGVVRSNPAGVTVEHTAGSGLYEVVFTKNVSGCAYQATIGDTATALPVQGQVSVSGNFDPDSVSDADVDTANNVFVQTFEKSGTTLTDMPFHLLVTCP